MNETEIYKQAIKQFGTLNQQIMLFEEMAELQKAVTKLIRAEQGKGFEPYKLKLNVVEEIVDVQIMIDQLKLMLEVHESNYDNQKHMKLTRLERLIKE